MRKKVVVVFGTRPEAIKMAPVVAELKKRPHIFDAQVCVTGQHKDMLYQALKIFDLKPDHDLEVMTPNQTLSSLTSALIQKFTAYVGEYRPDVILVHGDTTTSFAAALVGFYTGIKVGHIEAGLRTFDLMAPFPEEFNRKATGIVANLHFAPTATARENLLDEKIPSEKIFVTGNTIVDSLIQIDAKLLSKPEVCGPLESKYSGFLAAKMPVLVTTHRRENFGRGLENICDAIIELAQKYSGTYFLLPVHLNPKVREIVFARLNSAEVSRQVMLIEPIDYLELLYLMKNSAFVMTDSGGVQEEAPSFGKYVFVLREKTERPEASMANLAELVGTNKNLIVSRVSRYIDDVWMNQKSQGFVNPYGAGEAAKKIAEILEREILC